MDNGQPITKIKESLHILDTAACIVVVLQSQDPLMQNNSFILLKGLTLSGPWNIYGSQ